MMTMRLSQTGNDRLQEPIRGAGHIPVLDGLRGLAILMVMVAHFNGEQLLRTYYPHVGPVLTKMALMGLVGVDLFFVLSGFLITGILLDSKGKPGFFKNFYARRFLRIFPLYYFALFLVFWVGPHVISYDAPALDMIRRQGWMWSYLANIPGNGNWDLSHSFMLGHFWSLAVEEHFYLLWPAVVLLSDSKTLGRICLGWAGMTWGLLALGHVISGGIGAFLSWTTLTHTGGLALGSYCAVLARGPSGLASIAKKSRVGFVLLAILFGILSFIPRSVLPHPEQTVLVPVAALLFSSLLVLTVTASPGSSLRGLFSNRALRFTGKISYGLYVYHGLLRPQFERLFPQQALIDALGWPWLGMLAYLSLAISSSFLIAWLSWTLFEKQVLRLKSRFEYGT